MADDRVVVDYIAEVSWTTTDVYRTQDPDLAPERIFTFKEAGAARLPDNLDYDLFRRVLTLLKLIEHPVRAELAPNGTVLGLSVPEVGLVTAVISDEDGGGFEVHVSNSAAPLFLRPAVDGPPPLLDLLNAALVDQQVRIISVTDDHEIIAIKLGGTLKGRRRIKALTGGDVIDTLTPISLDDAQDAFRRMQPESCPIPTGFQDCIPFLYPDNGCWARAERMCDLLHNRQIEAGKLWAFNRLRARTQSRLDCRVKWIFHVATVVRLNTGPADLMVIDPSVFCGAATPQRWFQALGNPNALCELTDRTIYYQTAPDDGVEELPCEMTQDLQRFLSKLLCRAKRKGSPPYARCRPCPNGP